LCLFNPAGLAPAPRGGGGGGRQLKHHISARLQPSSPQHIVWPRGGKLTRETSGGCGGCFRAVAPVYQGVEGGGNGALLCQGERLLQVVKVLIVHHQQVVRIDPVQVLKKSDSLRVFVCMHVCVCVAQPCAAARHQRTSLALPGGGGGQRLSSRCCSHQKDWARGGGGSSSSTTSKWCE